MFKIISFIVILFFTFPSIYGQEKISEQFRKLSDLNPTNVDSISLKGQKLLKEAKNNVEFAVAYATIGDASYKKGNYLLAIKNIEKSANFAEKAKREDQLVIDYGLLTLLYRKASLIVESDYCFNKVKELSSKRQDFLKNFNVLQLQAKILEMDKKYCEALNFRKKIKTSPKDSNAHIVASTQIYLAFDYAKCGQIASAKQIIKKIESYLSQHKNPDKVYLIEHYYLTKAYISVSEKDTVSAKKWFIKAYDAVIINKDMYITKFVTEERLEANFDELSVQKELYKKLNVINSQEKSIAEKLATNETIKKINTIKEKERKLKLYATLAGIAFLSLLFSMIYYRNYNRKIKKRFDSIITELEKKNNPEYPTHVLAENPKQSATQPIIKNKEKESELIEALEKFEAKNLFTTKNISLVKMSAMLKTNTKYLNYILKEYRDSDFYGYINKMRIDFVIKELHNRPELLNYKIAALAEMSGFSNQSLFTGSFKAEKQITPSQYIKLLREKNDNMKNYTS